ncbi:hypothetical protein MTO96_026435 [Rhipicephalus appendiculatus]
MLIHAPPVFYFLFKPLEVFATLVRLPSLLDDRLLQAFLAFSCLPPWLDDARLGAWRRFLPRSERTLVAEEERIELAWRRLLLRLFLRWLFSDGVAELPRPLALRARAL